MKNKRREAKMKEYGLELNSKIYDDYKHLDGEFQPEVQLKSPVELMKFIDALSKDNDVLVTVACLVDGKVINAATLEMSKEEQCLYKYCEDYSISDYFPSMDFSLKNLIPKSLINQKDTRGNYIESCTS
jgi:hypothetical protein